MTAPAKPEPAVNPALRRRGRRLPKPLSKVASWFVELGEMGRLGGLVLWMAISRPKGYWSDTRDVMYVALKQCWFPAAVSTVCFGLGAPGLQGGNIYHLFGIPERLGSFFVMASIREFAPWVNAMVVAGVVGTAITADLGARRIRDEIDAMEVLGVEPVRVIVLPRVLACTIITPLLNVLALTFGIVGGWIASVPILGANGWAYYENLFANLTTPDMWACVVKTTIFGFIIGVVCCYKGLSAQGGPMGVGRAVNHAVVIAFAMIWVFNVVFTNIIMGLNPNIQVFK